MTSQNSMVKYLLSFDNQSVDHIRGATLDYKEGLMETGFSIDNPNVSRTCGCGNSFS
jgi:iron-sulfur cluster assembly accessory protein